MQKLEANGHKSVKNYQADHKTKSRIDFTPTFKRTMISNTDHSKSNSAEYPFARLQTNSQSSPVLK